MFDDDDFARALMEGPCNMCGYTLAQIDSTGERDTLRRDVERLTRERDAAYAASLRSDEVHAEAMRAVRARAEKAEAERDAARGQHAELLDALRSQERPDPSASDKDEILRLSSVVVIRNCEIAGLQLDLTAARAQVETHLESLETYEARIREIADEALGYQDPTAASIVLLDALERDYHRQRIARIQAEAQVERLRGALARAPCHFTRRDDIFNECTEADPCATHCALVDAKDGS